LLILLCCYYYYDVKFWLYITLLLLLLWCVMKYWWEMDLQPARKSADFVWFHTCERSKVRILEGGAEYQGSKIMILEKVKNMQYYYHSAIYTTHFQKRVLWFVQRIFCICLQASKLHMPKVSGRVEWCLLF